MHMCLVYTLYLIFNILQGEEIKSDLIFCCTGLKPHTELLSKVFGKRFSKLSEYLIIKDKKTHIFQILICMISIIVFNTVIN